MSTRLCPRLANDNNHNLPSYGYLLDADGDVERRAVFRNVAGRTLRQMIPEFLAFDLCSPPEARAADGNAPAVVFLLELYRPKELRCPHGFLNIQIHVKKNPFVVGRVRLGGDVVQ